MSGDSELRRFRTDDSDLPLEEQRDLAIFRGNNGDWYVGVVPAGGKDMCNWVRIRTSGGAAVTNPGLTGAIFTAYEALDPDARERDRRSFEEAENVRAQLAAAQEQVRVLRELLQQAQYTVVASMRQGYVEHRLEHRQQLVEKIANALLPPAPAKEGGG